MLMRCERGRLPQAFVCVCACVRVCVCACVRVFAWPENVTQRRVNWRHMVVFLTSEYVVTIVAVVLIRGITAQAFGNGPPCHFTISSAQQLGARHI